jgi:hypothetical protein
MPIGAPDNQHVSVTRQLPTRYAFKCLLGGQETRHRDLMKGKQLAHDTLIGGILDPVIELGIS